MSERQADHPTAVRVSAGAHRVKVMAKGSGEPRLEGTAELVGAGRQVTISEARSNLIIEVAEGTDLIVGTSAGRVEIVGRVGDVAVVSESGRVEIEQAESVDIRTDTSRVEVGVVVGHCRIRTTSGRIAVDRCDSADVAGESGRIELRHVSGPATAHCVSGRIIISLTRANDVYAETVTGRVDVSLPPGTVVHLPSDLSPTTPKPPGADCTVHARSVSGKVVVTPR